VPVRVRLAVSVAKGAVSAANGLARLQGQANLYRPTRDQMLSDPFRVLIMCLTASILSNTSRLVGDRIACGFTATP
jgi:hypothetical protein